MDKTTFSSPKTFDRKEKGASRPSSLRIPPQSTESEKALLGAIMLRPEAMHEVVELIRTETFYAGKNAIIFDVMLELFSKSDPIDLLTVTTRLRDKKLIDKIGGAGYVTELVEDVPSSANIEFYMNTVHKKYILRSLIEASDDISESCYGEPEDLEALMDEVEQRLFGITNSSSSFSKFVNIKEALDEAFERLDKLNKSDETLRGVPTGFTELDNKLAGLQKSDLIILAARPSVGKTSLALDIARQAACQYDIPVGIFSLEMSAQQLVDRMLAAEAKVDAWKLRTGKVRSDEDFSQLAEAMSRLSKAPIYIDDKPGSSILKMRSVARQMKRKHGLGFIIVDYLQLMTPTRHSDSAVQQVTEISRSLKGLARELDVPVLALSQLSRAVEHRGGKPRLSDLRDSGSIEQDADVVMFIHREKNEEEAGRQNVTEILIEKHRNGPTGIAELYFDDAKTTFLNIDKSGHSMSDFSDF